MIPDRHEATAATIMVGALVFGVVAVVAVALLVAVVVGGLLILLAWSGLHVLGLVASPAPWTPWAEALLELGGSR